MVYMQSQMNYALDDFRSLFAFTYLLSPRVDGGRFKRIPMYRDPAGGYGFASPFEFDSLLSLVLYYATNTMEKHNPELETILRYPEFHVDRGR